MKKNNTSRLEIKSISIDKVPAQRRWGARVIRMLFLSPLFLWGMASLRFGSWDERLCLAMAIIYAVLFFGVIILAPIRKVILFCFAVFLMPLALFFLMQPSLDRDWQPDVAVLPYAEIKGNEVFIHHVRHCDYITETDYAVNDETRTYNLSKLKSVDIMLTDWGLKYIAHTMVSFGFEGDNYLCFSIETRKEVGESYSALKGFFRQYELIYIAADERDPVRLRTNFRKGENVYLYRLKVASMENLTQFFMEYVNRINQMHENPKWYNALTQNCMTSAFRLARKHAAPGRGKWHWSIILNGFADRHAYEVGTIDTSLPFDELKRISCINKRALAAGSSPDYSKLIRQGIPGMDWVPGKRGIE